MRRTGSPHADALRTELDHSSSTAAGECVPPGGQAERRASGRGRSVMRREEGGDPLLSPSARCAGGAPARGATPEAISRPAVIGMLCTILLLSFSLLITRARRSRRVVPVRAPRVRRQEPQRQAAAALAQSLHGLRRVAALPRRRRRAARQAAPVARRGVAPAGQQPSQHSVRQRQPQVHALCS